MVRGTSTQLPPQRWPQRRVLLRYIGLQCWIALVVVVMKQSQFLKSVSMDVLGEDSSSPSSIVNRSAPEKQQPSFQKCALLFFGLPRSYRSLVLPSIVTNLLIPNAHHNCDIFVHYFNRTEEPQGRRNAGGVIDPGDVLLLKDEALKVMKNATKKPLVSFAYDTEDDFWRKRNATIQKYRTTQNEKGKLIYYPWRAQTYQFPVTMDNIVRQWHSVESAWRLMEEQQIPSMYTRVGMFRNDAMYLTPIDIFKMDLQTVDDKHQYAIHPPFGMEPTNDRSLYGPYEAVKLWATKRFELVDQHISSYRPFGWGVHPERFFQHTLFPFITNATGVNVTKNPDICFVRTRAEDIVLTMDCEKRDKGASGLELVERVLGRQCRPVGKPAAYKLSVANCSLPRGKTL